MTDRPGPPADWYPDPNDPTQSRYWDGSEWTDARQPRIVEPPSTGPVARVWWQSWYAIVPGLLFCLPLGLIGLWRRSGTTRGVKASVTALVAVLVLGAAFLSGESTDDAVSDQEPVLTDTDTETPTPTPTPTPAPPAPAQVPTLAGLKLPQAQQALLDAGLQVGPIQRQPSAEKPDTVLGQEFEAGTARERGSTVSLVVAAPFPKVPSLVGSSKADAIARLQEAGFTVKTSLKPTTSAKAGTVVSQTPQEGKRAEPGSTVQIVIAKAVPAFAGDGGEDDGGCTPGYSPCLPPMSDYDCAGGSGNGPGYTGLVHISGSDPYDLDRDGDGVGCG